MTNKFIFLTGGAKRIGKTTCKHFHEEGFNIIFHFNTSSTQALEIQKELNAIRKDSCFILQADFNDLESVKHLKKGVSEITDNLAVLINNASSFYPTPIENASMNDWNDLMATNATTPLFLVQALLPFLKKGKGCVINISDTLAPSGIKNFSLYAGAKSALLNSGAASPNLIQQTVEEQTINPYDIQDVGVRFYTYISTLHYIMEAAAENSIKIIVIKFEWLIEITDGEIRHLKVWVLP